ncbi:hypothetical protein TNCV_640591 [Trichonephila clavipes]|nr:hypothetical protein TNCV_640591 [Trichonephila clavipes]
MLKAEVPSNSIYRGTTSTTNTYQFEIKVETSRIRNDPEGEKKRIPLKRPRSSAKRKKRVEWGAFYLLEGLSRSFDRNSSLEMATFSKEAH